jgi:hypothetical protein
MKQVFGIIGLCTLAAACNDSVNGDGLTGAASNSYFAVVSTNYMGATTISLLGKDGDVVKNEWVGSKTKNPDLRSPLADDVVMPTTSYSRRYLTTIERGLGVVTRFDLTDGSVLGQLRTDDSPQDDMSAYHSNPQDVYYVSDTSAWVTRWAANPDANAAAKEKGTDLIEFDPRSMKRTARRIDLSSLDTMIEETQYDKSFNPIGKVMSLATASPSGLVPAGKSLVVGLVRITASYNYAPGLIAIVDPVAGKLQSTLELDGLTNCGEVRAVQDQSAQVLVGCIGTFGDGGANGGIVKIEVDEKGKAKVLRTFRVADHDGAQDTNGTMVSLGGDLVLAVVAGSIDPMTMMVSATDVAYTLDLKTGKQKELFKSEGAFSIGVPALDADTGALLVPDAGSMDNPLFGIHRFLIDPDKGISDDGFVEVAPKTTMAAREVHAL